jgi:hypothetical protein
VRCPETPTNLTAYIKTDSGANYIASDLFEQRCAQLDKRFERGEGIKLCTVAARHRCEIETDISGRQRHGSAHRRCRMPRLKNLARRETRLSQMRRRRRQRWSYGYETC